MGGVHVKRYYDRVSNLGGGVVLDGGTRRITAVVS